MLLQTWYYAAIFGRLAFYKKKTIVPNFPSTSIVICAKNEDHNIVDFLPLVLEQEYPEFEVVVVNDCSFDNTADVLEELSKKYARLKIVTIKENENFQHGKKVALMVGIKGATYEHLLLTDADCKPASKFWLKNNMERFSNETEIVLGYGAYEKRKGFLNKLIRFDAFYIGLQYLSYSLAGKPYMGVGRNLAYTKNLFFKHKGFASHYHIESGDDDLFINEAATKKNTRIEIEKDSITISVAKKTFLGWWRQKRRHITTSKHYKFSTLFRMSVFTLSQYFFWILFVVLLVLHYPWKIILGLFLFRLLLQLLIFKKSMDKLDEKKLILYSPLFELFFMFFYPALMLTNFFAKPNKWKN
ncbi:MAG: glycosyltransferase [Bacteroidia bacterium]